jgi:hypothetical protein
MAMAVQQCLCRDRREFDFKAPRIPFARDELLKSSDDGHFFTDDAMAARGRTTAAPGSTSYFDQ